MPVLVTTHYLEEAEQCNRLGFMVAGEVVAEGSPTEMKAMMQGRLLEIVVDNARAATVALRSRLGADRVSQFGDRVLTSRAELNAVMAQGKLDVAR